jgi:hypothetical protein
MRIPHVLVTNVYLEINQSPSEQKKASEVPRKEERITD